MEPEACAVDCSGKSSLEERTYSVKNGDDGKYLLGFVEFDDQGWFHDHSQQQMLRAELARRAANPKEQFLVVVFAHGWFHNASAADENVQNFRSLLERLDLMERAAAQTEPNKVKRTVVGVYLGWRGETLEIPVLKQALTFWSRMGAAERVGEGAAKQVLMELNQFKCYANGRGQPVKEPHLCQDTLVDANHTQMVVIGHSFGGLAVYHALRTEMMERTTWQWQAQDGSHPYAVSRSFGDLVLLVNPAFEGSAYEPLWRASQSRCYSASQRPVMMVVTSKTDRATQLAFPLGRLYTLTQSADQPGERAAVMATVGHLDRYRTYDLSYREEGAEANRTVRPTSALTYTDFLADAEALKALAASPGVLGASPTSYGNATLARVSNADRQAEDNEPVKDRNPFLVVSADPTIVDGHGDIWNDRFVDFMRAFFVAEIRPTVPGTVQNPACSLY